MPKFAPKTKKLSKSDLNTVKRLLEYFKAYKVQFTIVLVCIFLSAIASVSGSMFIKTLIDDYITPMLLTQNPQYGGLITAILKMCAIYAFGILSTFIYSRIMVTIAQGILKTIRDKMFTHMQSLPIKYFDTNSFGDVMSRYTNDADSLRQMLSMSIPQMFSSLITIVSVFCAMIYRSFYLTVLVIIVLIVMLKATKFIASKSGHYFVEQQKALGKINGYIEEIINGQKVVKVFCHEEKTKQEFDMLNENMRNTSYKANNFANILMPVMSNIGNMQYVFVAIVGGMLAISGIGGLTLGDIASFLQLSRSFTMPVAQISNQFNAIIMALAGAERIFTLMDEKPETDEGNITLVNAEIDNEGNIIPAENYTGKWAWKCPKKECGFDYIKVEGRVDFDNVDFSYDNVSTILHDITLFAKPGQKVAFVGATGAGKTTITNLINRFYDIADGKIQYDGININSIKKDDLRHSLGIVLQDTNLFTDTVMENIRYGRPNATDEDVYAAAKLTNADGFIRMLPEGYNTVISGSGSELSQGQKQLITIARAAIAEPPVMILDEATSSIDTRTEAIVQKGMDALMKGRTVFVIAHRLSTVRNSDVIMVLEHGRIIERGSHKQLIEQKGMYYKLYTGAFEMD